MYFLVIRWRSFFSGIFFIKSDAGTITSPDFIKVLFGQFLYRMTGKYVTRML